jgi:hypothetical protein
MLLKMEYSIFVPMGRQFSVKPRRPIPKRFENLRGKIFGEKLFHLRRLPEIFAKGFGKKP